MSDLEQRLRDGLAGAALDVTPPADPVAWVRSRVARDRRRRVIGAVVAGAALTGAAALAVPSLAGGQDGLTGSVADRPPATPSPRADDVYTLRADPFLTEADLARLTGNGDVRRVGSAPHRWSDCTRPGSEPGVDRRVAAFEEPSRSGRITEFVLRYDDAAAAHAAVDDLERQLADCPRQANQKYDSYRWDSSDPRSTSYDPLIDELFEGGLSWPGAVPQTTDGIGLSVARDGNVVVAMEFTESHDRTHVTLIKALNRAIGNQGGRCDKDDKFKRENFINQDIWEAWQLFERGCT